MSEGLPATSSLAEAVAYACGMGREVAFDRGRCLAVVADVSPADSRRGWVQVMVTAFESGAIAQLAREDADPLARVAQATSLMDRYFIAPFARDAIIRGYHRLVFSDSCPVTPMGTSEAGISGAHRPTVPRRQMARGVFQIGRRDPADPRLAAAPGGPLSSAGVPTHESLYPAGMPSPDAAGLDTALAQGAPPGAMGPSGSLHSGAMGTRFPSGGPRARGGGGAGRCGHAGLFDDGTLVLESSARRLRARGALVEEWDFPLDGSLTPWSDRAPEVKAVVIGGHLSPRTLRGWFCGMSACQSMDLSGLSTRQVEDFSRLFQGCARLTEVDVSTFDTSRARSLGHMFEECRSLSGIDVSAFDTRKVVDASFMFSGCESLRRLDLSRFDLLRCANVMGMLSGCVRLVNVGTSVLRVGRTTWGEGFSLGCPRELRLRLCRPAQVRLATRVRSPRS